MPDFRFFRWSICLLVAMLCATSAQSAQNDMLIATDTIFTRDLLIPEGTTCTVKPGVRIHFDGYFSLEVRGLLIAQGTADEPITFSAIDRTTGSNAPPGWKGIEIIGPHALGTLRHCRIEGAYRNVAWESKPSFDSCDFSGNHYGLYCAKKAAPSIKHCRFFRNIYGVAADFAFPMLLDNSIFENAIGLYLQSSAETIAGKNSIANNEINIKSENALGDTRGSLSLQNLWEVMQQLY